MKNNLIFHHIYLIVSESSEMRVCVCKEVWIEKKGCTKTRVLWTPKFPEQQTAKAEKISRFLHNHLTDFIEDFLCRRRKLFFRGLRSIRKLALYVIILFAMWIRIMIFHNSFQCFLYQPEVVSYDNIFLRRCEGCETQKKRAWKTTPEDGKCLWFWLLGWQKCGAKKKVHAQVSCTTCSYYWLIVIRVARKMYY